MKKSARPAERSEQDDTRRRKPRAPRNRPPRPAQEPSPPGPPSLKGGGEEDRGTASAFPSPESDSPPPFREGGPGGVGSSTQPPVPHLITRQKVDDEKVAFARRLCRTMTPEEKLLWYELRASRLRGLHFRRQQLIHGFVADFYCHAAGVVVEVDGGIHDQQGEYDATRDEAFATLGLLVLQFRSEEVTDAMASVLDGVGAACAARIAGPGADHRSQP